MKVMVNGVERDIAPVSIARFVEDAGWKPTQVVVEYNGKVLPRGELPEITLKDGDRLEIVIPVAGG